MKYCYRVESGEEVDMVAQNHPAHTLWDLDRDVKGYPMLPPAREGDALPYMKKLVRSFITVHYHECQLLTSFIFSFLIFLKALHQAVSRIECRGNKSKTAQTISSMIFTCLRLR